MKKTKGESGIVYNAAYLTLSAIFVKLIGLLYKVPMSYILTDEGMGYFNAAYTIYSILYLLATAGVPKAITVLVSGYKAEGNKALEGRIFTLLGRIFLMFGAFLCTVLLLCAVPLSRFLGSPKASLTICAIAPSLIFVSLGGIFRGFLSANHAFSPLAVSSVIEASCKLILGIGALWLGKTLCLPLYVMSALAVLGIGVGSLVSTLYLYVNAKIYISNEKIGQKINFASDKKLLTSFFSIALPITLGGMASGISSLADLSMIMRRLEAGGMSESEATAVYGNYTTLSVPLLQMAVALITPLSVVILPVLTANFFARSSECFRKTLGFGAEICAIISFPIATAFFFFSHPILSLIFNDASAFLASYTLKLLSPAVVLFALLLIANTALESIGKAKLQMLSMLIGIGVKIIASRMLLADPRFGILGAPIGTVLSYAASVLFSFSCLALHGISVFAVLKKQLLPALCALSSAFFALLLYKSKFLFALQGGIRTCAVFSLYGIFYFLFLFITGVLNVEKISNMSKQPIFSN